MPSTEYTTRLADLFDPQVVGDFIDRKLIDALRFAPLARIDTTLVGRAGDELTMPYYRYVGMAEYVDEGADIPISKLSQGTTKVKVHKCGKAIEFTDEAMLAGAGSIADEAARQVVAAINDYVEMDLCEAMCQSVAQTMTIPAASGGNDGIADKIADALALFGEDIDGEKVLLIPPVAYARLRKTNSWVPNTEIGANAIIRGTVGMVHGCQIVVSNRLKNVLAPVYTKTTDTTIDPAQVYYILNELGAYEEVVNPVEDDLGEYYTATAGNGTMGLIVKPGALSIVMKRDTLVEFDRDIIAETNVIKASKLCAPYVYDANKIIKLPFA